MSMVTQLVAAVVQAQQRIQEQIAELRAYEEELDRTAARVEAALEGSSLAHGDRLLEQIGATKKRTEDAIGQLSAAIKRLDTVARI